MKFLVFLFCAAMAFADGQQNRTLEILYTASLNGNLDGCDCKSRPRAGLVKRAAFLRNLQNRDERLLVDTGDILAALADLELGRAVMEVYRELGYDAVAVGDQEFSNGVEAILESRDRYPFLCHNLAVCPDEDRCVFFSIKPLLLEKAGLRIGLFALIDPSVFVLYPKDLQGKLKITAPKTAAENMVETLRQEGTQLNVVLFHGPFQQAETLAREVTGIHIIVVGHEQRLIDARAVGDTVLVSPGADGNILGQLTLTFVAEKLSGYSNAYRTFSYTEDPDDPTVRQRIVKYTDKLKERLHKK